LVGLAAVFVAISAFINPAAFNLGNPGNIKLASLIEMAIGAAVGAITFSGSVIAFLKLQGIMSGAPITFKGQHLLNALILISIIVLTYLLCISQSSNLFWFLIAISFLIGFLLIIPIGGADMAFFGDAATQFFGQQQPLGGPFTFGGYMIAGDVDDNFEIPSYEGGLGETKYKFKTMHMFRDASF